MAQLRKCLSEATRLERALKRGIMDRAKQIAAEQGLEQHAAEVEAVKEAQTTAARDLKAVKQAMAPKVAPTPGRGAAVEAKVQQMMTLPEERTALFQRVRDRVLGVIALNEARGPTKPVSGSEARRRQLVRALGEYNAILRSLPPDVRGRIGGLGQLAHIGNTEEALTDFLTGQLEKANAVIETLLQREFTGKIKDLLKSYKPIKKAGGALMTRIGDAQEVVTEITRVSKLDHDQVAAEQATNDVQLQRTDLDADTQSKLHMKDNILQLYGNLKERSAAELEVAFETLQTTIQDGRLAWGALEEARIAQDKALSDEIVSIHGQGSQEQADIETGKKKGVLDRFYEQLNFSQLLEAMFGENSNIAKRWGTAERKASLAKRDFIQARSNQFVQTVKTALGSNSNNKAGDTLRKMKEKTLPGRDGIPNRTSKMDAIYYRMAFEQKEVRERMLRQGWTQEHMDMLTDATSDSVSQAIYGYLRSEYEALYKQIDAVYYRQNGMHLPKIQFYSPMRYAHMGQDITTDPLSGMPFTSGTTASFLIGRVNHSAEVKQMDAMEVYLQHLGMAAQYIYGSDLAREMRSVLNRPETKKSLQSALGTASTVLNNVWMDQAINDGKNRAGAVSLASDVDAKWITSGLAASALALNPKTILIQWEGAFRSFLMMGPRRGISSLMSGEFWSNIIPTWKSDTIQRRVKGGMNPVTQFLMEKNKLTPTILSELTRYSLTPMILSDAAATSVMSAMVYSDQYREAISGGKSEAEAHEIAADAAEYAVYQYAQPIETGSRRARELKPDALFKMGFMFMTDPMMKTAMIAKGVHEVIRGVKNGDTKLMASGARKVAMVEVTALIAQFLSSAFKDATTDDDDEKIWSWKNFASAAALAPLQGWFMVGTMANGLISRLFKIPSYYKMDPLQQTYDRAGKALKNWENVFNMASPEEMLKEWDDILKTAGVVAGPYVAPATAISNVAKPALGVYKNLQKTDEQGFLMYQGED